MTKDCLDGDSGTVGRQRPWKSHPWVASTMDPALGRGPARSLSCPHKHHYHYHTPSVEGQFDNALEEDPVLPPARARFASVPPPPPRSGNNSLRHDRSQPTWLRLRLAPKENSTLPQHLVPSHTMNRPTPVRTVTTTHVQQPPPPPLIHSTVVVRAISPPSPWTRTPPLPPPTGARLPLSPRPVPKLVPKLVPTSHYHHLSHPSLKIIPDYRMDPAMRLPIARTVPSDWEHQTSPVVTLAVRDILLGRGGGTNQHAGNLWYRALLQHYRLAYTQAPKFDKAQLARNLTNYIRLCGGRFLQKGTLAQPPGAVSVHRHDNGGDCYYEVGDVRARLKVTQVLREEPPNTRKRRRTRTEEETTNAPLTAAAMFEQHQQQSSAQKR